MKPAQSYLERRAFGRRETNIKATVRAGHRMFVCTIRDISEGGALLEFAEPVELPPRLWLRWEDVPSEIICEIRRNTGTRVGVEFARPISLAPRLTTAPVEVASRPVPAPPPPPPPRENVRQTLSRAADLVARHRSSMRKGEAAGQAVPPFPGVSISNAPPPLPARVQKAAVRPSSIEVELASISERLSEIAVPESPAVASRTARLSPPALRTLEAPPALPEPPGVDVSEPPVEADVVQSAAEPVDWKDDEPAVQPAFLTALELIDAETLKAFIELEEAGPAFDAPSHDGVPQHTEYAAPVPLAASAYWIAAAPHYLLPPWPVPAFAYAAGATHIASSSGLDLAPLPRPPAPLAARLFRDGTRAPWPLPASAYR